MRTRALLFAVLAALAPNASTAAENIVSGVSTDLIQIQSDFTGTEFVVFGAVEGAEPGVPPQDHNIVVVVRGPGVDLTVRRKQRFLGVWFNRDLVAFANLPSFYYLASTRPVDEMAPPNLLRNLRLGGESLGDPAVAGLDPDELEAFRAAAVRNLGREGLYGEAPQGIEFLSQTLFRARVPVPANVPPGEYHAEVYLFRTGSLVTLQSSPLFVDKTGLERRVYEFAFAASLVYGLVAVFMAMTLGWLGFVFFRPR